MDGSSQPAADAEGKKSIPTLGILEEDDEFEEFPVEGTPCSANLPCPHSPLTVAQTGTMVPRTSWTLSSGRPTGTTTTWTTSFPFS